MEFQSNPLFLHHFDIILEQYAPGGSAGSYPVLFGLGLPPGKVGGLGHANPSTCGTAASHWKHREGGPQTT